MSLAIENVRKDIRMRAEADKMMSTAWLFIYIIPIVSIILTVFFIALGPAAFVPLMGLSWILIFVSFIVQIVLIYKLVKRRNTHFRRQSFLFEDVVNAIRDLAAKKGVDVQIPISSCERIIREAKAEETEKNAVLWAILSAIIFIASWYVYYFLMKDFYKHERREDGFWEDISRALAACGITMPLPRREAPIPDRSFILYLILTIITLGIFGIYWLYVLIKDPNEHFKYHIIVEDQLLRLLESVVI